MFDVSHSFQISLFIKSIGLGALIGAVYFFFVILRRTGLKKTISVIIQDILFFVFSALISFIFIFEVNAGEVRFFIFAGELMGFCLLNAFPLRPLSSFYYKCFIRAEGKAREFFSKRIKKNKNISKKLLHKK